MTVYIGVDFHARKQTISYLTTTDGEIRQVELDHQPQYVRSFYEQFDDQVVVGYEASGYAYWFEELLEELGHEVWVGDAAEIRRLARRRQKNDRRDANLILELMLRGDFPRLHRYVGESRQVLQQLRYRHRLVRMRTMILNSLQFITLSRGISMRRQLLTRRGQQRLALLALPTPLAQQRDELTELLVGLSEKIQTAQAWLEQRAAEDRRVQRVMTHPGIGPLTALCLVHTLGPVERFANPRKVVAYIGLDPVEDSSADRHRFGAISKQGSRLLRFLLVEAAQTAVRRDADLKRLYWRVQLRRNRPKAKVAVAHRLLVRAFIMLRDEIDYEEFCRRGVAARSARGTA